MDHLWIDLFLVMRKTLLLSIIWSFPDRIGCVYQEVKFENPYLYGRRLQCRLTDYSHSRNRWIFPHKDPGFDIETHSCCSGPGIQVGPQVWSLPSPPDQGWFRLTAESGCNPESPFVWKPYLLKREIKEIMALLNYFSADAGFVRSTGLSVLQCQESAW